MGELSLLLAELSPAQGGSLHDEVESLRRRVERSGRGQLPELALEALDLADASCWAALADGDVACFERVSGAAVALGDFSVGAGLLP